MVRGNIWIRGKVPLVECRFEELRSADDAVFAVFAAPWALHLLPHGELLGGGGARAAQAAAVVGCVTSTARWYDRKCTKSLEGR